ncbi:MAG: flagellar hook-basal body complex protein FliE [Planctomycetota bacterium]|nr:flagellar hook-basal body complex protein FliE [Planctomycetota bacterium]
MSIPSISTQSLGQIGTGSFSKPPMQGADGPSFKDFLVDSIREVNTMQQDADRAMEGLFVGDDMNPAEVLTAVQKADMAFRMMMQIRNKLVAAYDEVKNIRV